MGFFDGLKKKVNPEIALAKEGLGIQERGMYLQGADNQGYEELPNSEAKTDLLKWQQELGDEMERMKHRLRSEVKTDGKWGRKTMTVRNKDKEGKWVTEEVYVPPLANEIFIDYIQSQVEPFLSRNLINSNFKEEKVLRMLKYTCNDYADAMTDNYDRFEIDFMNANLIDRLIKNVITPGPYRAILGFTKIKDSTMAKRIEGFFDRPDKAAPALGSNMFGGKN